MSIEFKFVKHILSLPSDKKSHIELNIMSWGNHPAKLDVRSWHEDGTPYKGIGLTKDEALYILDHADEIRKAVETL
jgi:hypothetical protein